MAVMTSAPITRDQLAVAFEKAYEFFASCEEANADLATAKVKLGEAERAFERAGGELEQVMLDVAAKLVKTAKRMAYVALLQAAESKLGKAEEYQGQGYYCPRAVELLEPIRSAIQRDDAFEANCKASLAVRLYEQVVADIANSERATTTRAQLADARKHAKVNRELRRLENRQRAHTQGAVSKKH